MGLVIILLATITLAVVSNNEPNVNQPTTREIRDMGGKSR